MMTNQATFLLQFCETHLDSMQFWAVFDWWVFNSLMAISLTCSILVPFGLAIMLYIPKESQRKLQIATLLVSAVAMALQILSSSLHFADRATLCRETYATVQSAVVDYKDGRISAVEFRKAVDPIVEPYKRAK